MLNPLFGDGFKSKKSPTRKKPSKKKQSDHWDFWYPKDSSLPDPGPSAKGLDLQNPPQWVRRVWLRVRESHLGPEGFLGPCFFLVEGVQRNVRLYIYIYIYSSPKKKLFFLIIYLYTFCSFFWGGEWGVWMTSKTETSNRSHALSCVLFRSLLIVFLVTAL